jgi:hypothetical protein
MLINDAEITGSLVVNASSSFQHIIVSGNILPDTTNERDLGSTDKYFREIYVSTGSIYFVDNGIITASLSANTLNSLLQNTSSANDSIGNINSFTQSFSASVSSSITDVSSSISSSITSLSESVSISLSSSITSLSSSLTLTNVTQDNRLGSIESITGSYATTGSNTFYGTQVFTGSVYIANDLIVQGSSSIQYISASSVSIGTNIINLNTATPSIRYAGLSIIDSGSSGVSASLLWDSQTDDFIFTHRSSGSQTLDSSMFIYGPLNTGSLDNIVGVLSNRLTKGQNNGTGHDHHITSSQISDDGTTVSIPGALTVTGNITGPIRATNGVVSGSSQITGIGNSQLTNSTISGISLGSNLATLTIGTGLSGTSYNGSTGVTIANSGVTSNVAGTGVTVSGATGAVTISIGQSVATSATPSFDQVITTNNGNGTNYRVGDDAWFGDVNAANTVRLKGVQDATAGYLTFGNQATALGLTNSTTLTWGAAFTATGDVTAFSDVRVKENIKTIDNALNKVLCLRGVTFNRIDLDDKSEKMGVIAQEIKEVVPQVVMEENDKLSVAYGNLAGLFIEAIKEQQIKIDNLTIEVENLKKPKGL